MPSEPAKIAALVIARLAAGAEAVDQSAVPRGRRLRPCVRHPPFPDGIDTAYFGLGCFWGAERKFWQTEGVYSTAVGYAGGFTPNPTYREACSGRTGHTEAVLVVFDPEKISYSDLLRVFWESTTPPRGCARATTSAPSTARRSTGP